MSESKFYDVDAMAIGNYGYSNSRSGFTGVLDHSKGVLVNYQPINSACPIVFMTCSFKTWYLIIINVTHISMFRNYSFNFGRNVAKRGRNMERRRERNIAEPKFVLKSFRPSSCVF